MKSISGDHVPSITTLSTREVYRNRWMRVREDEILRSNGQRGIYGVVEKDDCATILPLDNGRVWLVEQFRYTIQERALELPQGGWEMEVDDPEELARGELREEIGMNAAQMIPLGTRGLLTDMRGNCSTSIWRQGSRRRNAIPMRKSTT